MTSQPFYVRVHAEGFDPTALRTVFAITATACVLRNDYGRLAAVELWRCEPHEGRDGGYCPGCDRFELGLNGEQLCAYCAEERQNERSVS